MVLCVVDQVITVLCVCFRDVNTELDRLTALLTKIHSKVAGKFNSVSYTHTQTHNLCSHCNTNGSVAKRRLEGSLP